MIRDISRCKQCSNLTLRSLQPTPSALGALLWPGLKPVVLTAAPSVLSDVFKGLCLVSLTDVPRCPPQPWWLFDVGMADHSCKIPPDEDPQTSPMLNTASDSLCRRLLAQMWPKSLWQPTWCTTISFSPLWDMTLWEWVFLEPNELAPMPNNQTVDHWCFLSLPRWC